MDDPLALSRQLCFAVQAAARAFERRYTELLAPLGLTYPQYVVMLALWQEDGQYQRDLCRRLHLDSGTLTPLLKRLEAVGLVSRARDAQDERLLRLTLTPKGQALRAEAVAIPARLAAIIGLSEVEMACLRDTLERIGGALRRGGGASDCAPSP
jgi:DNA-binding MarR family transcriptional regulator